MKRPVIVTAVVLVLLGVLTAWIANNTYWADIKLPTPLKGEALTNPFYAAQRFAETLGARTSWDRAFTAPPADAVVVLSAWHWNLSARRREALEHWVESGGRLVVDSSVVYGDDSFARWSGVIDELDLKRLEEDDSDSTDDADEEDPCRTLEEQRDAPSRSGAVSLLLCDGHWYRYLSAKRDALWSLRDETGVHAVRVAVGRGRVTVINGSPFRYRSLLDGHHGFIFVSATELRRGDEVHFLSEDDHPSLLTLAWQYGGPALALSLAFVALALWRGGVRFGPLEAPMQTARRSLAEQIRGTGRFEMRHGDGEALHAACVRALEEAVRQRVRGYMSLTPEGRADALARLTGLDRDALAAAIYHPGSLNGRGLHNAVALLESARRRASVTRDHFNRPAR